MYGFEPSDEQKMLVTAIQKYAAKDLREAAHDADEEGRYPPEVMRRGWELGVLQASIPEAYGGFGERSAVTGVLAAEEFAWGDLAGALAVMAPGTFALPTLAAGTEEQKKRWLPGLVEGDWRPLVAAIIEPDFDYGADRHANGGHAPQWQLCSRRGEGAGALRRVGPVLPRFRQARRQGAGLRRAARASTA